MDIYLPIAAVSLDGIALLILGAAVGFLSGVFGIGGGFLLTPLLILIGVPHPIAVASSANQLVGASVSGAVTHWRRGNVDIAMAVVMLIGGLGGSVVGVWLFGLLLRWGQVGDDREQHRIAAPPCRGVSTSIIGCTVCLSRCASAAPSFISARCCRWCWA